MKVKCTKRYNDKVLKKKINVNETLEVTKERGKKLIDAGVAVEVTEPSEKDNAEENIDKKQKKSAKNKE